MMIALSVRFGLVSSRIVAVCCHAKNCHVFCQTHFASLLFVRALPLMISFVGVSLHFASLRLAALSLFHSFRFVSSSCPLSCPCPCPPFGCNSRGSPGSMASHCASVCVFAEFIQLCSHTQTGERERERGRQRGRGIDRQSQPLGTYE